MKKILAIAASLTLVVVSANSQSEKKEPPPPPPKPKNEKVKSTQPEIIYDEKINTANPDDPVITIRGKKADEFYEKNPTVSDISRKGSVITIKKKDGSVEKYDMSKKEEDKNFTDKYEGSPIPPPPPPKVIKTKSKA